MFDSTRIRTPGPSVGCAAVRLAITHAYSWPEVRRGAERIIVELSRALAGRGHHVTVLTAGSVAGREEAGGVTTVRLQRRRAADHRHERDFGRRVIAPLVTGRFDAVHSLGPADALGAIRAARARPRLRTVYTNLGLPFRWAWDDGPHGRAHRAVVRHVDAYGCMSRFALDALAHDYGRQGVLTPGGVNLAEFVPAASREPQPTVLFSGALDAAHKGAARLLEAAAVVAAKEPGLRVWLSGPGDGAALIGAAPAQVRDRVEVLPIGDPNGLAERYARAWATALPSKGDSFGMALVESLACGTPIVASTHAAPHELVDEGSTGALCDPDDAGSVADALLAAFQLARRPGTVEACRAAARPYDWATSLAPRFEAIYAGG
jgi:phosphatidyl-myo-inositol alpha-mannosyltransferase